MNMTFFIFMNLIIYLPFHMFEEALGDFPKWMYEHKWLPYHMSHGHWMANNVFLYYPLLLISFFLFIFFKNMFICCGIAILIWGIINFGDHFFYTLKDRKISPGLLTGTLFLINSLCGIYSWIKTDGFSTLHLVLGLLVGGILFGGPMGLCIIAYPFFEKYIKN